MILARLFLCAGRPAVRGVGRHDRARPQQSAPLHDGAVLGPVRAVYLAGERLPPAVAGALMIAMALVAGCGLVGRARRACCRKRTNAAPARPAGQPLLPAGAGDSRRDDVRFDLLKDVHVGARFLLDPKNLTLVSMGCGSHRRAGARLLAHARDAAAGRARGAAPDRCDELGGGAAAHAGRARAAVFRGRRRQGRGPRRDEYYRRSIRAWWPAPPSASAWRCSPS
jgi:hypothetical protein